MIPNFLKKQPENKPDPFIRLGQAITLLPEFYRTEPAFSDCISLVTRRDPKAIDTLIALTRVDGHYFSERFWTEILACATLLDLPTEAAYCKRQIDKNLQELGEPLPRGWATVKTSASSQTVYIAQSIKDEWAAERRRKHEVSKLLTQDGFHLVRHGLAGTIYHVNQGQLIEIDIEMSGSREYDMVVYFESVTHYALPEVAELTQEEKHQLKAELIHWLNTQGIKPCLS
jgi:hypothetical protein